VATESDLEKLGVMGHLFAELYGQNLMRFDTVIFLAKMREFLSLGSGTVLCAHLDQDLKGALAGVRYENVFDGEPCASELFWYVWPGAPKGTGRLLLREFEAWAIGAGCTRVTMAYMLHNSGTLPAFYERNGYTAFETQYVKDLDA